MPSKPLQARILALALTLTLTPALASAQKPAPVELAPNQIDINNQAIMLLDEDPPRIEEAIKLVEAALVLEPKADLLYLTLGRAYQLDGQCDRATEQFDLVESAPGVQGVPPEYVTARLEKYRGELTTKCDGSLIVTCDPENLELTLAGEPLACGAATSLPPGDYQITGRNPETSAEVKIPARITGMETTRAEITLLTPPPAEPTEPIKDPIEPVEPGPVEPVEPPVTSSLGWRVTPSLGVGSCLASNALLDAQNGISATQATDAGPCALVGVDARVLSRADKLDFGASASLRGQRSWGRQAPGYTIETRGYNARFSGELWFSSLVGLYLGGAWRSLDADLFDACDDPDNPSSCQVTVSDADGLSLGGGVRAELGPMLGVDGLELHAGYLRPLSGTGSSLDEARLLLPLDLGLRAQFGGLTAALRYEAWFTQSIEDRPDRGGEFTHNHRFETAWFELGWTFGAHE